MYLYYNKKKAHNILYISDVVIDINSYTIKNELNYYFYLNILIKENVEIVNYSYSFDFINKLYKIANNLSPDNNLKKIIYSKFIIELINNFQGLDEYNEEIHDNKINEIRDNCQNIISDNIHFFKELNLNINENDIIEKPIEELYIDIINSLIKTTKIEDYKYSYNIMNQLEFDQIKLTKTMYNNILNILDNENSKKYNILTKEDLLKENKINFYFIILKYILKKSVNIYEISLLSKTRKVLLKLIKSNEIKYDIMNNDKLDYIIKSLIDSKYYAIYNNKNNNNKFKEILKYLKFYKFKSEKEKIKIIEDIIKNNKQENEEYLNYYDIAKKMNDRMPIIKFLFYEKKNKNEVDSEDELEKKVNTWNIYEKCIKEKKLTKIFKNYKKDLNEYFKNKNNREILIKIFDEEIIEFFIKQTDKGNNNNNIDEKKKNNKNIEDDKIINNEINNDKQINKKENQNIINDKNIQINDKKEMINSDKVQNNINPSDISTKMAKNSNNSILIGNNQEKDNAPPPLPKMEKKPELYKENNIDDYIPKKILQKSCFSFIFYGKGKEPFIDEIYFGEHLTNITYEQFVNIFGEFNSYKKGPKDEENNYTLFYNFIEEFKQRIKNECKYEYKFRIKLNFEKQNESNDNNILNILCLYEFYEPISNGRILFKDNNILIYGTNSMYQGFEFLITEINSEYYKDLKYEEENPKNDSKNKKNNNSNNIKLNEIKYNSQKNSKIINDLNNVSKNLSDDSTRDQTYIIPTEINKKAKKENILEFIKIVEKNNKFNGFINQLNNGHYIICKSDNSINLYDIYFNHLMEINGLNESIFNVCERINRDEKKNNKKYEIITCANNSVYLILIDLINLKYSIKSHNLSHINLNCLEMKTSNCVILSPKGLIHYIDLLANKSVKQNIVTDEVFIGAIRITENILALTSNSILPNGNDKLIFYNIKSKKISNSIEDYSFIVSPNGLALMQKQDEKTLGIKRILICACKKYNNEQKNGILLINAELSDSKNIEKPFYYTNNFEVNCICPIKIIENTNKNYDNINEEYKKNINIIETEFFLVGGFDLDKREGVIKLFKIEFGEKNDTKIQYMQDIELEENDEFEGFDSPINCIIQSKISGNIIISCYDEKIYMLTPPNIDYYLK